MIGHTQVTTLLYDVDLIGQGEGGRGCVDYNMRELKESVGLDPALRQTGTNDSQTSTDEKRCKLGQMIHKQALMRKGENNKMLTFQCAQSPQNNFKKFKKFNNF